MKYHHINKLIIYSHTLRYTIIRINYEMIMLPAYYYRGELNLHYVVFSLSSVDPPSSTGADT